MSSQPSSKPVTEQEAIRALRKTYSRLMSADGVTSVGVGYKITEGKRTNNICIQCTVEHKTALEQLVGNGKDVLPEFVEDEGLIIPVDVVERKFHPSYELPSAAVDTVEAIDAHEFRRSRQQTLRPGISVSNSRSGSGTVGAIVFDAENGRPLVLSNWHVLHGPEGELGDEIIQPGGTDDSPVADNVMGRLERSHLGMAGDCAVASIEGRQWDPSVLELNTTPRRIATANLDDRVVKSGRTTGVTYGIVSRVNVVVRIDYNGAVGEQEIGGFEIRIDPSREPEDGELSMRGDSGSLWMINGDESEQDIAVGLHFAGETSTDPDEEHALACKITSVCEKLKITFEPLEESVYDEGTLWREVLARLQTLEDVLSSREACTCGEIPHPSSQMLSSNQEAGVPIHGNWCGPGHGSGTPKDKVDAACMAHDKCYDQRGTLNCDCDRNLVRELDHVIKHERLSPTLRNKAIAMRHYFAASPCARYVKVGGATIPIPAANVLNNAGRAISRAGRDVSKALGRLF